MIQLLISTKAKYPKQVTKNNAIITFSIVSPLATIIAIAIFDSLVQFLLDNSVIIRTPIGNKKGADVFYQLPRGELFIKITMLQTPLMSIPQSFSTLSKIIQ